MIERRREYTVFGFDLDERKDQVVCNASTLALAMTDEARRELRCKPGDFHHFVKRQ